MDKRIFCVCAVGKDEEDYLDEWIQHHLSIGFDYIVFYDNNDNDKQWQVYRKYDRVIPFKITNSKYLQLKAYSHFFTNLANNFDYVACLDCDEFICFNPNQPIQNIKNLCIHDYYHLNWVIMDDNDLLYKDNRPLLKRFTRPCDINSFGHYTFPVNSHVKSIIKCRNKNLRYIHPHYFNCDMPCYNAEQQKVNGSSPFMNLNLNVAYIKHFYTKSAEEYKNNKMKHLRADQGTPLYDVEHFFKYNKFTPEKINILTSSK